MTAESMILEAVLEHFHRERRWVHERVMALAAEVTDEQLRWQPGPHAPSIGFHVWHLARYADKDRAEAEGTPQLWHAEDLARAWGFPSDGLGAADTGTEMGDEGSSRLVLPDKGALLNYAGAAFAGLGECLERLSPRALLEPVRPPENQSRLLDLVFEYVTHDSRHLGMIEALRGLLGREGTATR